MAVKWKSGRFVQSWEKSLLALARIHDTQEIHVVMYGAGGITKNDFSSYVKENGLGAEIPFNNNSWTIVQAASETPDLACYIFDVPMYYCGRMQILNHFWTGVSQVKGGAARTTRYTLHPSVIVFTDTKPDLGEVGPYKLRLWTVESNRLVSLPS